MAARVGDLFQINLKPLLHCLPLIRVVALPWPKCDRQDGHQCRRGDTELALELHGEARGIKARSLSEPEPKTMTTSFRRDQRFRVRLMAWEGSQRG